MDLYLHLDIKRLAVERAQDDAVTPAGADESTPPGDREPPTDEMRQDLERRLKAARCESD